MLEATAQEVAYRMYSSTADMWPKTGGATHVVVSGESALSERWKFVPASGIWSDLQVTVIVVVGVITKVAMDSRRSVRAITVSSEVERLGIGGGCGRECVIV